MFLLNYKEILIQILFLQKKNLQKLENNKVVEGRTPPNRLWT